MIFFALFQFFRVLNQIGNFINKLEPKDKPSEVYMFWTHVDIYCTPIDFFFFGIGPSREIETVTHNYASSSSFDLNLLLPEVVR